jgi:hypothetical protein
MAAVHIRLSSGDDVVIGDQTLDQLKDQIGRDGRAGTLLDIVDNQGRRRIINPVAVVELTERPDEPAQDESDATYQQAGGPRPLSAGLRDKPL